MIWYISFYRRVHYMEIEVMMSSLPATWTFCPQAIFRIFIFSLSLYVFRVNSVSLRFALFIDIQVRTRRSCRGQEQERDLHGDGAIRPTNGLSISITGTEKGDGNFPGFPDKQLIVCKLYEREGKTNTFHRRVGGSKSHSYQGVNTSSRKAKRNGKFDSGLDEGERRYG